MRFYRNDIDGLRALAVLAVLFCHLDLRIFQGGFVGVDIFFVISGFLISNNIIEDLRESRFSFKDFYIRRIRRLCPAMYFTILLSLITGYFLLSPEHLERLGGMVVHSVVFLPNIFLLEENGYFDTNSIFKPLLHFWSLGVEEQFYLIWPVSIFILRKRLNLLPYVLLVFAALSLLLAENNLQKLTYTNSTFYLPHFRIYEFAIGAICVFYLRNPVKNLFLNELGMISGLALIAFSVFSYSAETKFPGLTSLIPCCGACLIICSLESRLFKKILTNRCMVFTGLISYSLYLIHWPVIVYYRLLFNTIDCLGAVFIVLSSVIIATFMYYYIETPFRTQKYKDKTHFLLIISTLAIVEMFIAAHIWANKGWEWRLTNNSQRVLIKEIKNNREKRSEMIDGSLCNYRNNANFIKGISSKCHTLKQGKKNYLLIGDSHADDLYMLLSLTYKSDNFLKFTGGFCNIENKRLYCRQSYSEAMDFIVDNQKNLNGVILSARYMQPSTEILEYINEVEGFGLPVIVFGANPILVDDITVHITKPSTIFYPEHNIDCPVQPLSVKKSHELSEYFQLHNTKYYSKHNLFCNNGKCPCYNKGKILYTDESHFSPDGAEYFGKILKSKYINTADLF